MAFRAAAVLAGLCGCGDQVREDRTIRFSDDGAAAGFQHGSEGVYVADRVTGELVPVFSPDEDVLAVGTPLFSPDGRRLIFTTARRLDPPDPDAGARQADLRWDDHAAGRPFGPVPVRYTCWLRDRAAEEHAVPRPLFEAVCDHAGYVAANFAVRWRPDGERILYLDVADAPDPAGRPVRHALYEFSLRDEGRRQVFPFVADALLFDWSPDGRHLACTLGSRAAPMPEDGLWIGDPDEGDWWHVPDSQPLTQSDVPRFLEHLGACRPVWTRDGTRFAWVRATRDHAAGRFRHALGITTLATRETQHVLHEERPVRDVHWSPAGELGFLAGEDVRRLYTLPSAATEPVLLAAGPVRRYAGWNATGDRMAWVVPDETAPPRHPEWAFLFFADPDSRDALLVAGADGARPVPAFSGMQITFPHWSPEGDDLSLWGTFNPTYRSFLSMLWGWGLRPGDPAAILDTRSGDVRWLAVNAREQAQIGHYHLLHRRYEEALRWYELAAARTPPGDPPRWSRFPPEFVALDRFDVFHWHCLRMLGREEQARAHLEEFRRLTTLVDPDAVAAVQQAEATAAPADVSETVQRRTAWLCRVLADLYVAEVLLSVGADGEARRFFGSTLDAAADPEVRLGTAIALSQLLLIAEDFTGYARLVEEHLAPFLPELAPFDEDLDPDRQEADVLSDIALHALLPLYAPEFLDRLPDEAAQRRGRQLGLSAAAWLTEDRVQRALREARRLRGD